MPHIPIPRSASQVMKNFRIRQLEGLTYHLRLHGPLPTIAEAAGPPSNLDASTTTVVTEPSIVLPNPFIARKNPRTGKWRAPKYSLRRQADLVKSAKATDSLAIIPPGPKLFAMELRTRRLQASLAPADVEKDKGGAGPASEPQTQAGQRLEKAQQDNEESKVEKAQEQLWTNPFWVGDVRKKPTKGEELGIKLYAGKKRMFKGHSWEKKKAKRLRRQNILMRDMKARIARYKSFYKKRKPNPLKPSRLSKPPKLPF